MINTWSIHERETMPVRSGRACSYPGCPAVVHGQRFCQQHAVQIERQYQAQLDDRRGSSSQRGYGAQWRKARTMFLAEHPLCVDPYGDHARQGQVVPATDVDHILPRRQGGSNDASNLQALCHVCHSKKTSLEVGRRRWTG